MTTLIIVTIAIALFGWPAVVVLAVLAVPFLGWSGYMIARGYITLLYVVEVGVFRYLRTG